MRVHTGTRLAFVVALTTAVAGVAEQTAVTRVVEADARARRAPHKRRRLWALLGVLVVIVAVVAGVLAYRAYAGRAVAVPSIVGMTKVRAVSALHRKGFIVGTSGGYSDTYAPGVVMAQRPEPGVALKKGLRVRLVVSRGLLHLAVVSVVGQTSALRAQSFVPKRLSQHSNTVPKGQVVRQSPAAGVATLRRGTVRYWVSSGPAKVPVPDVVGASEGSATDALKTAGFAVAVKSTLGLGTFPGNVVRQLPAANALVPRGARVTIWVAIF